MADFSIEALERGLSKRKIPLLILDERYNIVMPDKDKTPQIRKLEAKINALLKKQGKVTNDIKEVKKIKARLLQDVVDNMDGEGKESARQKKMDKTQKLIQEAKAKLEELEDSELSLPRELESANRELLLEFIQVCYGRMSANREDIELLDKWINEMRVELKKKLVIKQEKETKNSNIYAYMHDLLGPGLIQMFDEAVSQSR
ncbi:MAG: hypothetical protein NC086_11185 [Alistipes sp.]|nr:hypothetical protein [Alistipes sp.]